MASMIAFILVGILVLIILYTGIAGVFADHELPEVYDIIGSEPGPFICIISGTHGNEPAGTIALKDMLNMTITRGRIRIIPAINPWGLRRYVRYAPGGMFNDINRNYARNIGAPREDPLTSREYISTAVLALIRGADLVLDFHEGWGYSNSTRFSIGSSVTPSTHGVAPALSSNLVSAINDEFKLDGHKKFTLRTHKSCSIEGTLGCRMQHDQRPYILIETTGQFGAQSLEKRISQVKFAVLYSLEWMWNKESTINYS